MPTGMGNRLQRRPGAFAMSPGASAPVVVPAFLRPKDAAVYLSISERQLRTYSRAGLLPCSRLGRRLVLFARADLDAAMRRLRTHALGEPRAA